MTKILLILSAFFVVACGEKVSTDTVQLSKNFMQALITMDKKTLLEIKRPFASSRLSMEHGMQHYHKTLKDHGITLEELKYTMQKGKTSNVECVVVQSNGTRKGNANLPLIHWRLKFMTSKKKEGLFLEDLDAMYGHFRDKGCRK